MKKNDLFIIMSGKQSKSSKKKKKETFSSRQRGKLSAFKSKIKTNIYDKIIHQEVYINGQEPKSYSFEKKFFGLYFIFIFYSLVLIAAINFPDEDLITILTFGDPFAFSNTISIAASYHHYTSFFYTLEQALTL